MNYFKWLLIILAIFIEVSCTSRSKIYVFADKDNDLCKQLDNEGYTLISYTSAEEAIKNAPDGAGVLILAAGYPETTNTLSKEMIETIQQKKLRCYAEYVSLAGNDSLSGKPVELALERGVVTSKELGNTLSQNALLGLNRSYVLPVKERESLLVTAKVVGFERAEFGLDHTPVSPLLFMYSDQLMMAASKLSGFATGRFAPEPLWKELFEYITGWVTTSKNKPVFKKWLTYVHPMYGEKDILPPNARKQSIEKGIEWFFNGHFFLSDETMPVFKKYETSFPYGPSLPEDSKNGDGSLGVLEGHGSIIKYNGKQDYRYWLRNDVQGEVVFAMMVAGKYLNNQAYMDISGNLMKNAFDIYLRGVRSDNANPNYGIMSWITLYPGIYYGDDNARALLGYIVANEQIQNKEFSRKIVECILANYRTSSKQGYRGSESMWDGEITKNGWKYYFNRDYINPHPHFESWIWACYLWLYDKTGYTPLLDKARTGITTTMESYPDKWRWTNGIQQERGRMILPLAWLMRVEPTAQHKEWLNTVIDDLLKSQVACGAIQEQMGDPSLNFVGEAKTNDDYGKYEAPLIYRNGDPVSDMLYTTNFAFFGLNEAVTLTGNPNHEKALERMSDFLIRIQVSSEKFKDVDGAWFRAFNYKDWGYWADNADNGWGAWCTLTGWIQSWIVGTQVLLDTNTNYWDMTKNSNIGECMDEIVEKMLN